MFWGSTGFLKFLIRDWSWVWNRAGFRLCFLHSFEGFLGVFGLLILIFPWLKVKSLVRFVIWWGWVWNGRHSFLIPRRVWVWNMTWILVLIYLGFILGVPLVSPDLVFLTRDRWSWFQKVQPKVSLFFVLLRITTILYLSTQQIWTLIWAGLTRTFLLFKPINWRLHQVNICHNNNFNRPILFLQQIRLLLWFHRRGCLLFLFHQYLRCILRQHT